MNDAIVCRIHEQVQSLLKRKEPLFPNGFSEWTHIADPKKAYGPRDAAEAEFHPTGNTMLDNIGRNFGGAIHYGSNDSCNAFDPNAVDPRTKTVKPDNRKHYIMLPGVAQFRSQESYQATLAHELIHWIETRHRAGNTDDGMTPLDHTLVNIGLKPPPKSYIIEEITAELGAAMLLERCGAEQDMDMRCRYAANYLALLPEGEREAAFKQATEHAEEDVDKLMWYAQ